MPIEILGTAELSELLAKEAPAAAHRYLLKVAAPAADVVIQAAQETVPVRYGVLQAGIRRWTHWTSGDGGSQLEIDIGPSHRQYWGLFLEFGTKEQFDGQRNPTKRRRARKMYHHGGTPARHWFLRAWEGCKDKVLDTFASGAKEMVERLRARQGAL